MLMIKLLAKTLFPVLILLPCDKGSLRWGRGRAVALGLESPRFSLQPFPHVMSKTPNP